MSKQRQLHALQQDAANKVSGGRSYTIAAHAKIVQTHQKTGDPRDGTTGHRKKTALVMVEYVAPVLLHHESSSGKAKGSEYCQQHRQILFAAGKLVATIR